jgi:hypothetical protein
METKIDEIGASPNKLMSIAEYVAGMEKAQAMYEIVYARMKSFNGQQPSEDKLTCQLRELQDLIRLAERLADATIAFSFTGELNEPNDKLKYLFNILGSVVFQFDKLGPVLVDMMNKRRADNEEKVYWPGSHTMKGE